MNVDEDFHQHLTALHRTVLRLIGTYESILMMERLTDRYDPNIEFAIEFVSGKEYSVLDPAQKRREITRILLKSMTIEYIITPNNQVVHYNIKDPFRYTDTQNRSLFYRTGFLAMYYHRRTAPDIYADRRHPHRSIRMSGKELIGFTCSSSTGYMPSVDYLPETRDVLLDHFYYEHDQRVYHLNNVVPMKTALKTNITRMKKLGRKLDAHIASLHHHKEVKG